MQKLFIKKEKIQKKTGVIYLLIKKIFILQKFKITFNNFMYTFSKNEFLSNCLNKTIGYRR